MTETAVKNKPIQETTEILVESRFIETDKIIPNGNVRTNGTTNVDDLKKSIKKVGLIHPITVRPGEKKGEYILVAGSRRLRACKSLKFTIVRCEVVTPEDANLIQTHENLHREEMPYGDYITVVRNMISDGIKKKDIAIALSKPVAWITQAGKLANLVPEIAEFVPANRASSFDALAGQSHAYQREWLSKMLADDDSVGTIQELHDQLKREGAWQYKEFWNMVEDHSYSINLDNATWDIKKEFFLDLPACEGCAFRGDKQLGMFSEFHDADAKKCMNLACYKDKGNVVQQIITFDMEGIVERRRYINLDNHEDSKSITIQDWLALETQKKKRTFLAGFTHYTQTINGLVFINDPVEPVKASGSDSTASEGDDKPKQIEPLSERSKKNLMVFLYPKMIQTLWDALAHQSKNLNDDILKPLFSAAMATNQNFWSSAPVYGIEKEQIWDIDHVLLNMKRYTLALYVQNLGTFSLIESYLKAYNLPLANVFEEYWKQDVTFKDCVLSCLTVGDMKLYAEANDSKVSGKRDEIYEQLIASDVYTPKYFLSLMTGKYLRHGNYSLLEESSDEVSEAYWENVKSQFVFPKQPAKK